MAVPQLVDALQNTKLEDPLVFSPQLYARWSSLQLSSVPRYLFRLYTPRSDGETTAEVASSKDAAPRNAAHKRSGHDKDIFAKDENSLAATARNIADHLRWTDSERSDNLVSWTSSLLFVLRYIFKKHFGRRDGSNFDEIYILIIDTKAFPTQVFIRDLDLISAFEPFDHAGENSLGALRGLRSQEYYFGEYLSQGTLNIKGRCRKVSAQIMIDLGLLNVHPVLHAAASGSCSENWAKPVIAMRRTIRNAHGESLATSAILSTVFDIAMQYGGKWRLPVAINLLSILPYRLDPKVTFNEIHQRLKPTGAAIADCAEYLQATHAPESMTELVQARALVKAICFYRIKQSLESSTQLLSKIMDEASLSSDATVQKLSRRLKVAGRLADVAMEM